MTVGCTTDHDGVSVCKFERILSGSITPCDRWGDDGRPGSDPAERDESRIVVGLSRSSTSEARLGHLRDQVSSVLVEPYVHKEPPGAKC